NLKDEIHRLQETTNAAITASEQLYEQKSKACYTASNSSACFDKVSYEACLARKAIDNDYFSKLAAIGDRYESNWYPKDVKYYNSMVYLRPFVTPNERVRKSEVAVFTLTFASEVTTYSISTC